jgi:uncharacterized membrane protein YjdF
MTRVQKAIVFGLRGALVVTALCLGVVCLANPEYKKYGGVLASLILPFLPVIVERLFRARISFRLQMIYYVFLFVALFLGIDMDFYKTVPHFDKVIHLLSGVLSVVLGYYVLRFFKIKGSRLFRALFMVCFAMAIAVLWEFFEFFCDKFLGQSMQQLVSVGVDDTMLDLLMAFVGSVIGAILLVSRDNLDFLDKD